MKKLILLIMTAALVVLPVLSCAADNDGGNQIQNDSHEAENAQPPGADDTEDLPGENGEPEELRFPDLPEVDFGGYNFRILNAAVGTQPHILFQLVAEEETGELLNDAIFRRNRRMEERFGFNLVETGFPTMVAIRDSARRSVQAGSDDFDLAMMQTVQALPLAQDGLLEMIDRIPYIDLTAPWWDQDMIRDLSLGHRLFFATSDFSFSHYSATLSIIFNQQIHSDLGLDCPYTLVREGRWTIDRFAEQARAAQRDLTGDGTYGEHDQWGFVSNSLIYPIGILNGIGARYVIKDADDMPVLNLNTEAFISRLNVAIDILMEGWLWCHNRPGNIRSEEMFFNGRGLFWTELLNWAVVLRGIDFDFGILPFPKLNEQQERHITGTGHPHVKSIPVTTADLARTGIIIEALSAESRLTTLDVYLDTMLVNQLMNRDEESAEMLDIIFSNRVYEIGRKYWNDQVSLPIQHAFRDGNRDMVSVIERNEAAANAAIQRTIEAFLYN